MKNTNIKKALIFSIVLVMTLLPACSSPTENKAETPIEVAENKVESPVEVEVETQDEVVKDSESEKEYTQDIIMASELLSKEDAEKIFGVGMETTEKDKELPQAAIQCVYQSDDYILNFYIRQDALRSDYDLEYGVNPRGTFRVLVDYQKEESPEDIVEVMTDGLGEEAYFIDSGATDDWSLHILEGDYEITVSLFSYGDKDNDWIRGKLLECGDIIVKNLKVIAE